MDYGGGAVKQGYERNVARQMREMRDECIRFEALPLLLIAIDGSKRGHMFWPDDLPQEFVEALPALLDDVRETFP